MGRLFVRAWEVCFFRLHLDAVKQETQQSTCQLGDERRKKSVRHPGVTEVPRHLLIWIQQRASRQRAHGIYRRQI